MEPQWFTVFFVGGGFFVTLIVQTITITSALNKARKEIDDDAERRQREVLERLEREGRIVGETILAIRQELANHKLYSAEVYQRRDSFHQQMSALTLAMNTRFEKLEDNVSSRFEKVDLKLDRIFARFGTLNPGE